MKCCVAWAVAAGLAGILAGEEPKGIPLWPNGAPGAVGATAEDVPTLTVYLPAAGRASGAAAVVTPGGGYGMLSMDHEGYKPGKWLAERGIAAFVLKSRLAPRYRHPAPMLDAQRALRLVRSKAQEMRFDPAKIGIWGFSAGGHLASTAATHFDNGNPEAKDAIDRFSCRPDFAILAYPVISMAAGTTHGGSKKNLLGDKPDAKLVEELSNHLRVTKQTPPTYLFHTAGDKAVVVENSLLFFGACRKSGVPVELNVLEHGGHGVGMAEKDAKVGYWTTSLERWLQTRGLMK
jgi:acetyl esterase/lipase